MATRKTASKKSAKVQLDADFNKPSKKTTKKVTKKLKKLSFCSIVVAIMLLAIGAVGGYFGVKYLTKNDCFEIIGKDEITLTLDQTYKDESCKVVAFGQNDADKIEIETNLTKNEDGTFSATEAGTYYIVYKVNNLKYGTIFKVQKIRLITFVEPSEQEEMEAWV